MNETELSGRQQLELSLLCIDRDEFIKAYRADVSTDAGWEHYLSSCAARLVPVLRYVRAEGITTDHFDAHQCRELNAGYTAALMLACAPSGYARDCIAARALTAAGLPFNVYESNDEPDDCAAPK